jgi:LPXTG-motif cell wall-anchored protein
MSDWLMWGVILPLLLILAGIITMRRRNHRR